jgi:hypothetical protein
MPISSIFFMILAGIFALIGLFGAAVAEGYLYAYSLMLIGFGLFYGFGIIKRHYDLTHPH